MPQKVDKKVGIHYFENVLNGKKFFTEAKTLREVQVVGNRAITGHFSDRTIYDYLVKHNPSQLEFARSVCNFTRSCAGYRLVTTI